MTVTSSLITDNIPFWPWGRKQAPRWTPWWGGGEEWCRVAEVSYVMRVHVEKKFIGFSADQTSLKIYSYQAPRGSSWAWRTRRSASGSGTRSSSEEFSSCSTTCSEQMKKVIPLHGQRALRDRGLGRLRARGATRSDLPWAPTPGKKIAYKETTFNLLQF